MLGHGADELFQVGSMGMGFFIFAGPPFCFSLLLPLPLGFDQQLLFFSFLLNVSFHICDFVFDQVQLLVQLLVILVLLLTFLVVQGCRVGVLAEVLPSSPRLLLFSAVVGPGRLPVFAPLLVPDPGRSLAPCSVLVVIRAIVFAIAILFRLFVSVFVDIVVPLVAPLGLSLG